MLKTLAAAAIVLLLTGAFATAFVAAAGAAAYAPAMLAIEDARTGTRSHEWRAQAPFLQGLVYDHVFSDVSARVIINDRLQLETEARRARAQTGLRSGEPTLLPMPEPETGFTWWPYALALILLAALLAFVLKNTRRPHIIYWRRFVPGAATAPGGAISKSATVN